MFPPKKEEGGKPKPDAKKKPGVSGKGGPSQPPGPGAQQNLHSPPPGTPKPGEGIDPMQAMMQGMGDMSAMGPPPPPAPGAPMGENGMPVGGNLPSSDPMMDPSMDGSSLFQGLNMQLDPAMGGGEQGADPELEQLLQLLALSQAGVSEQGAMPGPMGAMMPGMPPRPMGGPMGRLNPSGVMNEPTHPGESIGLRNFDLTQ